MLLLTSGAHGRHSALAIFVSFQEHLVKGLSMSILYSPGADIFGVEGQENFADSETATVTLACYRQGQRQKLVCLDPGAVGSDRM